MFNHLLKFCGLIVSLLFLSNSVLAQNIECRQPVSTVVTPGECAALDLEVLPPFTLNDVYDLDNTVFTRIPAGNDFPVGTTTLMWTVSDGVNTEMCESIVIIEDDELPVVGPCTTEFALTNEDDCLADVVIDPVISDNCGVVSVTGLGNFSMAPGLYEHPVTVTDVNGNVKVHIITIQVHDDFGPEFTNCPEEPISAIAGPNGTASYPQAAPTATDNCGAPTITSFIPEGGLPIGENTVAFTANDEYGNWVECEVTVNVSNGITAQHPESAIESSLGEDETSQIVSWNALNASTFCELCETTTLEGFRYVGTYWGHQYFLANEVSLTREDAQLLAEGYDAHLAVINDAAENAYLTEALDEDVRSAWIGLMPEYQNETWTFAWDNGDATAFSALNIDEVNENTRIILTGDGTWEAATDEEDKYFLIERPCVNITQTGPIYQEEAEEDELAVPGVLLRSGDAWPQGDYEVTYEMTDMCGNESTIDFPVVVGGETAEYCTSVGTDNGIWIEKVVFHNLVSETESNDGYADYTEENLTMNIGDGVIMLNLKAGGNEAENMLYWRVYLDRNNDGDFFDASEMIFEMASASEIQENLTLPVASLDEARMRVVVSRYGFSEPCGDTYVGEIEDYKFTLLTPEDYEREMLDVEVAVYPNPANSNVNLDLTNYDEQNVTVQIFDNLGKLHLSQVTDNFLDGQMNLDLTSLSNGFYYILISAEGRNNVITSLVVNKSASWTSQK